FACFLATLGESDFSTTLIGYGPGLPDEIPATAGGDSDGDLPVPVQKACERARVYDDAGSAGGSRKRRLPCCLLPVQRTSAPRTWLTPLNTSPAHSPVNASLAASRLHAHDLGSVWLATPCTVTDFHPLPSAGLPAHPGHPISGREQSQQRSPYSITSSARSSMDSGIARPSAFAVVRLM